MRRLNRRPRLEVGTRVGMPFGSGVVEAWVIEDRGDLATDGSQIVTLYYVLEPDTEMWTERRASELVDPPDPAEVEAIRRYWARGRRTASA
jgi:hypothetical protein